MKLWLSLSVEELGENMSHKFFFVDSNQKNGKPTFVREETWIFIGSRCWPWKEKIFVYWTQRTTIHSNENLERVEQQNQRTIFYFGSFLIDDKISRKKNKTKKKKIVRHRETSVRTRNTNKRIVKSWWSFTVHHRSRQKHVSFVLVKEISVEEIC